MVAPWEKYGQPQQGVQVKPVDPRLPYQVQKDRNEAAASGYAPSKAQADAAIAQANAANAFAMSQADLEKARAQAAQAQAELAKLQSGKQITADVRKQALDGYLNAQSLRAAANQLNDAYIAGPGSTKGLSGLSDYIPNATNKGFDILANSQRGLIGNSLGFTGGQLNTAREAEMSVGPYIAKSSDYDSNILSKIQLMNELADKAEKQAISTLGGIPDANGNVTPVDPNQVAPNEHIDRSTALTGPTSEPVTQYAPATKYKDQVDPVLKGVAAKIGSMVAGGASDQQVTDFLRSNGINPADTNIGEVFKYRQTPSFKAWQRGNVGKPFPVGPNFYTKQVPLTPTQQIGNAAAQSAPGAFMISAGNAVSGNQMANVANWTGGDGEAIRTGLQLSQANSPMASFTGDLAGQMLFDATIGKFVPFSKLKRTGELVKDGIYGGLTGYGEDGNALGGAAANIGGGIFGRRLGDVVKFGVKGIKPKESVKYLYDNGIEMTPGQLARGSDSVAGNAFANIEDRFAGLPVTDAIINGARTRGVEDFNRAAFRGAGGAYPYAGHTGSLGMADLGDINRKAYSFLDSRQMQIDPQFTQDMANIRAMVPGLPAHGEGVTSNLNSLDALSPNGMLSGKDWQAGLQGVRVDRASLNGAQYPRQATEALSGIEQGLNDLASRQGPGMSQQLADANAIYRKGRVLGDAVAASPSQRRGELFSPLTLNQKSIASQKRLGLDPNSTSRPFYDLTNNALDVMPNEIPDSGTAGRGVLFSTLGGFLGGGAGGGVYGAASDDTSAAQGAGRGGLGGAGTGLLLGSLLAAPYSKTGQKVIAKALMAERPELFQKIGSALTSKKDQGLVAGILRGGVKRLPSSLGQATLRDIVMYPELYTDQM